MNRAILPFLISAAVCLGADPDKATTKEVTDLIHSLPAREQLAADVALFKDSAPPNEKQHDATERLEKAAAGFKRLRASLRPGTSVFDYPGLIALTRPIHNDFDNRYSMVIGIPPGWNWNQPQGTNPDEYRIAFDGRGIITAIDPVIYRH